MAAATTTNRSSTRHSPRFRSCAFAIAAAISAAFVSQPTPASATDYWSDPYPGVHLLHRVTSNQNIFAAQVNLCAAGISIRATSRTSSTRTVPQFGASAGVQLAINGDFFAGGSTDGMAAHGGDVWGGSDHTYVAPLAFGPNKADLVPHERTDGAAPWMQEIVSGHPTLVIGGQARSGDYNGDTSLCGSRRHPRTATGLSADRRTLIILVADGRATGRIGLTCDEEASMMIELGAADAVNFDGGGSSTFWTQGGGVLNHPSDGSPRYVLNHLGVYASGSGAAAHCPAPEPVKCDLRAGRFGWNCAGPIAGMACTQVSESSDPDTWGDNYFCADYDIGARWSSAGAIAGMRCIGVNEGSEPAEHFWGDNFLCVPEDSPFTFQWSSAGPIAGLSCLQWLEPGDPHTWNDNYLCWTESCDARKGHFGFNCSGPIGGLTCTQLAEASDPDTWSDNYFCADYDIGARWSSTGAIAGMRCAAVNEPSEPAEHFWGDNFLCVPPDSPFTFEFSSAGPLAGRTCLPWREISDPHTWYDNFLCWTESCDSRVGRFRWSCSGPIAGKSCTQIAAADPDSWSDNYLCADYDIGARWSGAGAIEGMRCTAIAEPSEPAEHGWGNSVLCVPPDSPFTFQWSSAGPIAGLSCLPWREPADPHTWYDNYLCWSESHQARAQDFAFSGAGPVADMTCTKVDESLDPDSWADNYFCADSDVGARWSSAGPIAGLRCTAVTEPSEPADHGWSDDFLCVPESSPYTFTWSSAGPVAGLSCLPWRELSEAHSWYDNYLCWSKRAVVTPGDGDHGPSDDAGSDSVSSGLSCGATGRLEPTALGVWLALAAMGTLGRSRSRRSSRANVRAR